jgi:acetyl/propionyl-CoA carboxylase alpha subunit
LRQALADTTVLGLDTNAGVLAALLDHPEVVAGHADTGLIARDLDAIVALDHAASATARAAAARALLLSRTPTASLPSSLWDAGDAFSLGPARSLRVSLACDDGSPLPVVATWTPAGLEVALVDGTACAGAESAARALAADGRAWAQVDLAHAEVSWPAWSVEDAGAGDGRLVAPIGGRVAAVFAAPGDVVASGDRIATIEAMKMEHVITAPHSGVIGEIAVEAGRQVTKGALVARIDTD